MYVYNYTDISIYTDIKIYLFTKSQYIMTCNSQTKKKSNCYHAIDCYPSQCACEKHSSQLAPDWKVYSARVISRPAQF